MGLRPWEFWRMTPEEFAGVAHGYARSVARHYERAAWTVAYLLAPYRKKGSKPPSPEKLLGPHMTALLKPRATHRRRGEPDE